MKINEIVTEAFNPETSFPIEWDDRHGPEEMHGRAYDRQGGFIDIKFIALRNGVVEVEFSRNDSYDMTGAGDANRVLATILEAFREYLLGHRPKIFVFSAKGGSRSRVYQSMINRFAQSVGYKQFDTSKLSPEKRAKLSASGTDLMVLRRATPVTEEEFNGIDIDMEVEGDEIMVTAMANGRELGHVLFVDEGEYLMPQDLEVDERFQGQGIAAAMYDYVKSKGYKIRRSGQQTDAGAGFWNKHRPEQNVWEDAGTKINFTVQKSSNKFATTMTANGEPAGVYQYNADTGRSIAEVYPEYRGKGLGKVLVLHAIYTAAKLGMDFVEDESRTSEYDNVLDSLSDHGYIVDDDGYWYVTGAGEQFLKGSLNENFADGRVKGKSRPGRVRRAGASCLGSVTDLRARAKNASGEKAKMYHWCANMKSGRNK